MLFNSGQFFFFFLIVYLFYIFLDLRKQNYLLLLASYTFYIAWDYRFLGLIVASTLIDFVSGSKIYQVSLQGGEARKAQFWLSLSLLTNLGLLGFFKYYNFFAQSLVDFVDVFGLKLSGVTLDIILPVGISFYTFQTLSYSIDIYNGRQKPVDRFSDFALYVAFFPQLMAGPIERARRLLPQLQKARVITSCKIHEGGWLILWGVFKKVYIADNLAPYVHWAFAGRGAVNAFDIYIATFAFAIQLYCDFSGYSDMARGLAKLLGIELSVNFNLPYWATNPSLVWQRWHMTLSNWFRDYVFKYVRRQTDKHKSLSGFAVIPTMTLVGMWHGAAWKYIVFGWLWGIVIYLQRIVHPFFVRWHRRYPGQKRLFSATGIVFTFHVWLLLLVMFISVDIEHCFWLWRQLCTDFSYSPHTVKDALTVVFFGLPLLIVQSFQFRYGKLDVMKDAGTGIRVFVYTLFFTLIVTHGAQHLQEFIYFQF